MKFTVVYEQGPTSWGASVPDLPGCIAVGESRADVETLIREAVRHHLETLKELGIPAPMPAHAFGEIEVASI
jgi:predicted RNase H-like HicB family nuclease